MIEEEENEDEDEEEKVEGFLSRKQIKALTSNVNAVLEKPITSRGEHRLRDLAQAYYFLNTGDLTSKSLRNLEIVRKRVNDIDEKKETVFFESNTETGTQIKSKTQLQVTMEILSNTKNLPKTKKKIIEQIKENSPKRMTSRNPSMIIEFLLMAGFLEKEPMTKKIKTKFKLPYEGAGD